MTALYSIFSGLWGVIVTDAFQFVVAMGGTILLAVFAVDSVGGLGALTEKAAAHFGSAEAAFGVLPPTDQAWLPLSTLLVFLGVQWWAAWYPGQEPGGGGYVVQRILSAKDERHGLLATLWFTIAHYALRPWPWILVGFVGADPLSRSGQSRGRLRAGDGGRPALAVQGLAARGLCRRVHEHHQHAPQLGRVLPGERRVSPLPQADASRKAQVIASRVATGVLMVLSLVVMAFLTSVEQGWKLLIGLGAGTGLVLILRWYWWRVNAWSEISAMVGLVRDLGGAGLLWHTIWPTPASATYAMTMLITVGVTTVVWLSVTLLTPPESEATLERFYRRVRPGGPGWRPVSRAAGLSAPTRSPVGRCPG